MSDLNNKLNRSGINLQLTYTGEVFSNIAGGNANKSFYLDNFDIESQLDFEKILGWEGAELKIYFLGNQGCDPAELSGALQGTSNIAAHNTWKLYEFWLAQKLFNNKLSLLVGLFDLNSEFDTRESSSLFINPSHGIGAEFAFSGKNGPSIFPTTSFAFRLRYNISNYLNIKVAVLDGIPGDPANPNGTKIKFDDNDGTLLVSEFNHQSKEHDLKAGYFKYGIGFWYYSGRFQSIGSSAHFGNSMTRKGNYGMYLSAEKFLYHESDSEFQGLSAFVRTGFASCELNLVNKYLGGGITYIGLLTGRDEDFVGIAIAAAHSSPKFRRLLEDQYPGKNIKEFEYIIEFTYNLKIYEYLEIQPDIQYVINPISTQKNNSFQIGIRTTLLF